MSTVGFEPTISAGERPQTYALDRSATGTGENCCGILNDDFISNVCNIGIMQVLKVNTPMNILVVQWLG